jgi:two-component system, OmpR family, response regulator
MNHGDARAADPTWSWPTTMAADRDARLVPMNDPDQAGVLIVEDDAELAELVRRLLVDAGDRVEVARDGQAGLHLALARRYSVLIIDRGLPGLDGLELLRRLRRRGVDAPALILSAFGTVQDRVAGLDAGAEDYLVKPFDVDELLARLRALRRRHHETSEVMPVGAGWLDLGARCARLPNGTEVVLSGRELDLLTTLARRPGRVFSRSELRERVFDAAESASIVDTYVHYLRRKLGAPVIRTVRGLGYRIGGM